MSDIDHKAEALRIIKADNDWTVGWETADAQHLANFAEAQVHANIYAAEQTAALVKQQTIANLIAYTQAEGGPYKFINWTDGANEKVLTLIREGLGLS